MGYLSGFGGAEQKGSMTMDSATIEDKLLTAYVRNNGKVAINFDSLYVNGIKKSFFVHIEDIPIKGPLNEGQIAIIRYYDEGFISGQNYEFKLVSKEGIQLIFNLKTK